MVRGYTIPKETERFQAERRICSTKTPKTHHSNLDYEKLYQRYLLLQKLVGQLREDIKVKDKTIVELQEKLSKLEVEHQQSLKMHKEINAQNKLKIESFYKEVKELKELVMGKTKETERMNEEVEKMKNECDERIQNVIKKTDAQINAICQTHKEELAGRDSKLSFLKMQLESALSNNSKERQRQLDELTKELRRVTDETEMLKAKLRSLNKQKQYDKCRNCMLLEEALESKLKLVHEKDSSIEELLQHCQKMSIQLSRQDEFFKLCQRSNVKKL